jgi:archaellum component FlaC
MQSGGIPWAIIGPLATLIGALIGIGVGWGSMKSIVTSLKAELVDFKSIASEMKDEVTSLKVNSTHSSKAIEDLQDRMRELERDVATLKAKQPNRRK